MYCNSVAEYSECDIDVCENRGNCRKLGSSYTCDCVNGYTGLDCEIGWSIYVPYMYIYDKYM